MTPSVELQFTGPVRRPEGVPSRSEVPLPGGAVTIAALLDGLGFSPEDRTFLRAVVDGTPRPLATALSGGEKVTVFLPVGGG